MTHYNPFIASQTQSPPGNTTNPHNFPKCSISHLDLWFSWQIWKRKKKVQEGRESMQLCMYRCSAGIAGISIQSCPCHAPGPHSFWCCNNHEEQRGWTSGADRSQHAFNGCRPIAVGKCWHHKPCWNRLTEWLHGSLHIGMPSRGTWTNPRNGPVYTSWGWTGPSAGCCKGVETTFGTNTGWGMNRSRAALQRSTWGCWGMKTWTWSDSVCSSPESQLYPGLCQKQCGQQDEGGDSAPLL